MKRDVGHGTACYPVISQQCYELIQMLLHFCYKLINGLDDCIGSCTSQRDNKKMKSSLGVYPQSYTLL